MSSPKEKAKELLIKFRNEFDWVEKDYNIDLYRDTKQCALIAVDEIINSRKKHLVQSIKFYEYWQEVKQEIKLL
jgi:hypothetical protein